MSSFLGRQWFGDSRQRICSVWLTVAALESGVHKLGSNKIRGCTSLWLWGRLFKVVRVDERCMLLRFEERVMIDGEVDACDE